MKRLRVEAGLSMRGLASRTGFSASFVSQVEKGLASPSIHSTEKIAVALGVTLGELFSAAATGRAAVVVRKADRVPLSSAWSGDVEALGPGEGALDPVLMTLAPGEHRKPYTHASEEFALVLDGTLTLSLGPETLVLEAGDSVTIRPGELRVWENLASAPLRLVLVSPRPRASRAPTGPVA